MKLNCKTIQYIPIIASLTFLVGCVAPHEPQSFISKADKYAYIKEYMSWYINNKMDKNDITGLSVALVDDQKIIWSEGFGYSDKKNGIKATPQTKYRAGSITKLFTAMSTMKLAEEGKINIDKPLKLYLPSFSIKSRFGSTNSITPRNLMTHHSGLPGDWLDRMFSTKPLFYKEYVKVIKNEYVAYRPNTIFSYSNLGVTLLGNCIEKVSGIPYAAYVKKKLLEPMSMHHADLNIALSGKDSSKSYENGKEINEYAVGAVPAGALNISVEELSHLAIMINADGIYKYQRVLNTSTLKEMFRVQNKNIELDMGEEIGLGYFIDKQILGIKDIAYHHGGNTVAQNAYFIVSPHSKLGVVVMANTSGSDAKDIAREMLKKAWEIKFGKKINKQKLIVKHNSQFEGTYATVLGKANITKDSDTSYTMSTSTDNFKIYKTKNNLYKLKYKLFGLIPMSFDETDKMLLYTKDVGEHHLIIINYDGNTFIGGMKVTKPTYLLQSWKKYIGTYKILNNLEPEDFKIEKIDLLIEDGYLLAKIKMKKGDTMIDILTPITDTEAIIEGLGRGMQETMYFKEGVFNYSGLRFKKI